MYSQYQIHESYEWNYDHPPAPVDCVIPEFPGDWSFCGKPLKSPLGIAAGPLLNGAWILYYASLGFDLLTYKTVRSKSRKCYDLPNLQPVETGQLTGQEEVIPVRSEMNGSWAVSFGMPSKEPEIWRADIAATRKALPADKLLNVSVVGTERPGFTLEEMADDYALCARWAVESGADTIEANMSCPNVSTCDGQLFQQHEDAGLVAARIREQIGDTPLIIKVGHVMDPDEVKGLVKALAPSINACAMTNSVAVKVKDEQGGYLFEGASRGICGAACRTASLTQTRLFRDAVEELNVNVEIVGVGGVETAEHVQQYLDAGAASIQLATAAMVDPTVGISIRDEFSA